MENKKAETVICPGLSQNAVFYVKRCIIKRRKSALSYLISITPQFRFVNKHSFYLCKWCNKPYKKQGICQKYKWRNENEEN